MTQPAKRLDDLMEQYWTSHCEEWPLLAFLAGVPNDEPLIAFEAPSDYERRARQANDQLAEVDSIERAFANGDEPPSDLQKANLSLLRHQLHSTRREFEIDAHLYPSLFPSSPVVIASQFANSVALRDDEGTELYVERLRSLPRWLADIREGLTAGQELGHRYPRLVLEKTAQNIRATLEAPPEQQAWLGPFERARSTQRGLVERWEQRALDVARDEVQPAFLQFAEFLVGPLGDTARDDLGCRGTHRGEELYRHFVSSQTTLDLEPEAIHQLGLEEAARIEAIMAEIVGRTEFDGDVEGFRRSLEDPVHLATSGDQLRYEAESFAKRVDKLIPAFFGRIPRITYGIESMNDAMSELMPPAYAQPNPADRSRPGIFWLNSIPSRCPLYMLRPFTLHEAWPGHLMHLALMQEDDQLPEFRRHGFHHYHVMLEAWALYCESLGEDMGLYETPVQLYGRYESELWRALRLVVDTGIHWHGWSRDRAIDTMCDSLVLPRDVIAAEVDRYIGWPGQALIYQIGNIELRKLRKRAEEELGEAFDLRSFHDAVLDAGPVTLPVLSSLIEQWLG